MSAKEGERRCADYLEHILEAVKLARDYCGGLELEGFLADKKTQQAVLLNLMVIGEAATRICKEFPEFVVIQASIPWKQMRGMRNRLAHGYFEVDLGIIWDTVQTALPDLEKSIREVRKAQD